jgi:tetratricopeptide (TPR) repeat protein
MEIFVIMPFHEDFDDVYHIIKDSGHQVERDRSVTISTLRADEITEPGRISLQVTESIKSADLIIADITGNNPNVMYELGYAHALEKTVVLLTQSVKDSPFDVKDFRQVTYERSKLLRDCRPRLIAAITSVVSSDAPSTPQIETSDSKKKGNESQPVRRPGSKLVAEVQELHLELELSNHVNDLPQVARLGKRLREIIDSVTVVGRVDEDDARNTAGVIGNCAVELEKAEEYEIAETIFTRAITLFPDYAGLRIQYADFLFDRGQEDDARRELHKAKELKPTDERIPRLENKFRVKGNVVSADDAATLRQQFLLEPSNTEKAVSYLVFLMNSKAQASEFIDACRLWEDNLTGTEKLIARRALADFLANTGDDAAIPIFEELIDSPGLTDDSLHGTLHNLATMYAVRKESEKAKRCWLRAIKLRPNDAVVKAAFSQFLSSTKDFDLARKVIRGEPIP